MILNNKLDSFFMEVRGLTLVYGPSASGKSTLAMQSSLEFAKKGKVLFFDTEKSFSIDRIKLMQSHYNKLLENIIIVPITSFDEQIIKLKNIEKLVKIGNFDYVVIDSFGIFYRHALHNFDYSDINKKTIEILKCLKHVVDLDVPVLITNQVYSDKKGQIKTVGGQMIRNFANSIIELKLDPRKIKIHKPEENEIKFNIDNSGFIPF